MHTREERAKLVYAAFDYVWALVNELYQELKEALTPLIPRTKPLHCNISLGPIGKFEVKEDRIDSLLLGHWAKPTPTALTAGVLDRAGVYADLLMITGGEPERILQLIRTLEAAREQIRAIAKAREAESAATFEAQIEAMREIERLMALRNLTQ